MTEKKFNAVFDDLKLRGVLLLTDSVLPSVAGLVAGSPPKGSWWAHSKGSQIFSVSERLSDHADVAIARLLLGKVAFVHRRLWSAILAVGKSREPWQIRGLSPMAKGVGILLFILKSRARRNIKYRLGTPQFIENMLRIAKVFYPKRLFLFPTESLLHGDTLNAQYPPSASVVLWP